MATLAALQDQLGRNLMFVMRVRVLAGGDALGAVLSEIAKAGPRITETKLAELQAEGMVYDIGMFSSGDDEMSRAIQGISYIPSVQILGVMDAALESHRGGACEMRSRTPIRSNTDLRVVYTPGVARVCKLIEHDPSLARQFTNIANKVAIVTNGTAILGLGDIGPLAGLPVMEGKSAIFWEFVKISAEPVLVDTHDADEFINVVSRLAVGFGAIQVEDVSAPSCFKITRALDRQLEIPVMHDDQHGTATVVMAGLLSALAKTGRKMSDIRCVMSGAGAAGTAIADLLLHQGIGDVVLCDRVGALYRGRLEGMNPDKHALAARTNKDGFKGTLAEAMKDRDLFIGVSQANIVSQDMVRSMAKDPIIFALANPVSEVSLADAKAGGAAVYADGRMMNNALAYPGIFRGALDTAAKMISVEMVLAAAKALADRAGESLMPEMMDPNTHRAVAAAVVEALKGARQTPLIE